MPENSGIQIKGLEVEPFVIKGLEEEFQISIRGLEPEPQKPPRTIVLPSLTPWKPPLVVAEDKVPKIVRDVYWGLFRGVAGTTQSILGGVQAHNPLVDLGEKSKEFQGVMKGLSEALEYAGPAPSVTEIKNPEDALSWVFSTLAEQGTNVAALGLAVKANPLLGAGLGYLMNSGETYVNLRQRGVDHTIASLSSGLTGVAKTALDLIVPFKLSGKLNFLPLTKVISRPNLAKRLLFSSPVLEGSEEAAQEVADIMTEMALNVGDKEGNVARVLNAFAAGALTGKGYDVIFSLPNKLERIKTQEPEPSVSPPPPEINNPIDPKTIEAQPPIVEEKPPTVSEPAEPLTQIETVVKFKLANQKQIAELVRLGILEQNGPNAYLPSEAVVESPEIIFAELPDGRQLAFGPEPGKVLLEGNPVKLEEVKIEPKAPPTPETYTLEEIKRALPKTMRLSQLTQIGAVEKVGEDAWVVRKGKIDDGIFQLGNVTISDTTTTVDGKPEEVDNPAKTIEEASRAVSANDALTIDITASLYRDFGPGTSGVVEMLQNAISNGEPIVYNAKTRQVRVGEHNITLAPDVADGVETYLRYATTVGRRRPNIVGFPLEEAELTPVLFGEKFDILMGPTMLADDMGEGINLAVASDGVIVAHGVVAYDGSEMAGAQVPGVVVVDMTPELANAKNIDASALREAIDRIRGSILAKARAEARAAAEEKFAKSKKVLDVYGALEGTNATNLDQRVVKGIELMNDRIATFLSGVLPIIRGSAAYVSGRFKQEIDSISSIGVLLADDRAAATVVDPKTGKRRIYVNPYLGMTWTIDEWAGSIYAGIVHELAHTIAIPEGANFIDALQEMTASFMDVFEKIKSGAEAGFKSKGKPKKIEVETNVEEDRSGRVDPAIEAIGEILAKHFDLIQRGRVAGVFFSDRTRSLIRRVFTELRGARDPALAQKLEARMNALIANRPMVVMEAISPDAAEATVEGLGDVVKLYRANVPRTSRHAVDLYDTEAQAREAAREFFRPIVTDLEGFEKRLAPGKPSWFKIGPFIYKATLEGDELVLKNKWGQIVAEGPKDDVLKRLEEEIKAFRKHIDEGANAVTEFSVPRDMITLKIGGQYLVKQSPEMASTLAQFQFQPSLRVPPRGVDKGDGQANKVAEDFAEKTASWTQKARDMGVESIGKSFRYLRKVLMLYQIAERFPKLVPLQKYVTATEAFWTTKTNVLEKANGILELWVKLGFKEGRNLGVALQNITRKSFELKRRLTEEEIREELGKNSKSADMLYELFVEIDEHFRQSALQLIAALKDEAKTIYGDAAAVFAQRWDEFETQVRERNYFPLTTFGKFGVAAYDQKGKMVGFWAFIRQSQAEALMKKLRKEEPGLTLKQRFLSDEEIPLLQFPPALIDYLAAHLQLSSAQVSQLREIQQTLNPSGRFARHLLKRSLVVNPNPDAMAAYADYFQHFSNHYARIKHRYELEKSLLELDELAKNSGTGYALGQMVELLSRHLHDLMNPSTDMAALRAGLFLYMFSALPTAAIINLTQVPIYTFSYLGKQLNSSKAAFVVLENAAKKLLASVKSGPDALSEQERNMMDRAYKMGFIEESFASNIGNFSQKDVLMSFWEGAPIMGYYFHRLGKYSVSLFHAAEVYNRKITFLAAIEAGKRLGITDEEALFQYGKKAVSTTQFEYAYFNRPEIFRGGKGLAQLKPVIGVFKMFLQNHLYFAFTNQGGWRFWFMLIALAGLKGGVPFAEDILNIIDLLGTFAKKKLGLKNPKVDLELQARKFIDKIGANPDLFLHGLSRYGFGLGLANRYFGLPFPSFDLSNMLSMQEVLPFIKPITQGILGTKDPKDAMYEAFFKTLGAAFTTGVGAGASLVEALKGDPNGVKYARLLPRGMQYVLKAYRASKNGYYMSSTGQPLINVDLRDPTQMAELIAYAIGFQPTRLTQRIQTDVQAREHIAFYEAWKSRIASTYAIALATKNEELRKDTLEEMRQYQRTAPPEMRFIDFREAVRERIVNRRLKTLGLPPQRRYMRLFKELEPLHGAPPQPTQ